MLNEGYVRLFRSITSWEWYDDIPTFRLFTHLLLTCNWQEKKWHGHLIKPGQRVVSLKKLSEETGLSLQAVRTAISHMESTGELTRFQHGKIGVVAIKNWDKFQEGNTIPNTNINTKATRNQHGTNTELTPNEESKKVRKQEIPPYSPPEGTLEEYRQVFLEECPSLPKPQEAKSWSPARKKALKSKRVSLCEFRDVCKKIERSDFLTGRSGTWAGCSLDWVLKPANWQKILEGNYDNKTPEPQDRPGKTYRIEDLENLAKFYLPEGL